MRRWLRTADGKLAALTLALAFVALIVYLANLNPAIQVSRPAVDKYSLMRQDLRGGMNRLDFFKKYDKPDSLDVMPRGLHRLHYGDFTVTFDEAGRMLEMSPPPRAEP